MAGIELKTHRSASAALARRSAPLHEPARGARASGPHPLAHDEIEAPEFCRRLRSPAGHLALGLGSKSKETASPFAKEVVVATVIDAGAGHLAFAKAFLGAAGKQMTQLAFKLGKKLNPYLNRLIGPIAFGKGYELTVRYAESVYDWIYNVMPTRDGPDDKRNSIRRFLMTRRLAKEIADEQAKVNISFHPVIGEMVNIVQIDQKLPLDAKNILVVPDDSINAGYNILGLTIAPSEEVADDLVREGKERSMIVVVPGFASRHEFSEPYDRLKVREELSALLSTKERPDILGKTEPVILAIGGGNGAKLDQLRDFLPAFHPSEPIKLIVACGTNERLFRQFERLRKSGAIDEKITLIPQGRIAPENIPNYLRTADAVIGKSGAGFLGEIQAIASAEVNGEGKALAVFASIAGQEANNTKRGAKKGWIVPFKLADLNQPEGIRKFVSTMKSAGQVTKKLFPNAKDVAKEWVRIALAYRSGEIKDSPQEIAKRSALELERFPVIVRSLPARLAQWGQKNTLGS